MITLTGDPELVARVAVMLKISGQVEGGPFRFPQSVSVHLERERQSPHVEVDGVDGPFEASFVNHVTSPGFAKSGKVLLARRDGVRSDRALALRVPVGDDDAVALALVRACYETLSARDSKRWWRFWR